MAKEERHSILFVCTANQCRSPMAEALLKNRLTDKDNNNEKWNVQSAGCWAFPDFPATDKAVQTVAAMGCDLSLHESKAVSEDILKEFNLILTMEADHKKFIKRHFPEDEKKVFLLSEMIDEEFEIDDPVGGSLEEYNHTAEKLQRIIDSGFKKLSELSKD